MEITCSGTAVELFSTTELNKAIVFVDLPKGFKAREAVLFFGYLHDVSMAIYLHNKTLRICYEDIDEQQIMQHE